MVLTGVDGKTTAEAAFVNWDRVWQSPANFRGAVLRTQFGDPMGSELRSPVRECRVQEAMVGLEADAGHPSLRLIRAQAGQYHPTTPGF
jgi:hypothetical protein